MRGMHTSLVNLVARLTSTVLLVAMPAATGVVGTRVSTAFAEQDAARSGACRLGSEDSQIHHLIWLQFDNVHFTRDNPNVPSDLEQMPHLLSFIEANGTLLTNHHTPLIAHTATDILTTLSGVYGDRHGVSVSNSYRYFKPNGTSSPAGSFTYWTDPLFDFVVNGPSATDKTFNMLAADARNAPAPWVPFTRAGCDVGAVGTANIELENLTADVPVVFGPTSPEAQEVTSNPDQAAADFIGISIHCAQSSTLCAAGHTRPDLLPDEPGGYQGFVALFGHKNVAPVISPGSPLTDLTGKVIDDGSAHVGFPGFDGMVPTNSLAYVLAMQEHGVPITFNYVSAAHDANRPFGPGEADYEARLHAFDDAFATFFNRLQQDGITPRNTLFMFTADEGDHLIAGPPSPAGCDGVHTTCSYSKIGEVSGNLAGLLATDQGITTPFAVHSDAAPTVYITGNPAQTAGVTRAFERGLVNVTAVNPYSNQSEKVANFVADQAEMRLLHMVTADPARTPTVTMFAKPDYFLFAGARNCNTPCISINPNFNWNHGDVAPEINTTFMGLVGPGVRHLGVDHGVWTDHTDTRPTVLALLGLKDDYRADGRVIFEILRSDATPDGLHQDRAALRRLADAYKQLNAAVGQFGLDSLKWRPPPPAAVPPATRASNSSRPSSRR